MLENILQKSKYLRNKDNCSYIKVICKYTINYNFCLGMKKLILALFIICIVSQLFSQTSQSNCPNSDFSQGNFNNWRCYYGTFAEPALHSGIVPDRHVINAAPGSLDSITCYGLLTVPAGEAYAARLGNPKTRAEGEQLRYSITVTNETNLFIYKYAVVLQNPFNHKPNQQPSFTIKITNENGVVFDSACGYYYVYGQQGLPGWSTCDSVVWKDWTTVGLDLNPYLGHKITIVFTTKDCSLGAHFGYAYLSAYCSKLQMTVSYCTQDSSATLTAPPGFTYLWSNGDSSQSITINYPDSGAIVNCILTSVNGCQVTIYAPLFPTIVNPNFSYSSNCTNTPILFTDLSHVNQNEIIDWVWDFGDESPPVMNTPNPTHIYTDTGTYYVKLKAYSFGGCCDSIVKPITIYSNVYSDFSFTPQCNNLPIPFSDLSTINQDTITERKWDFGDGSLPVTNILNPTHTYESPGTYNVSLIASSPHGCSDTITKSVSAYPLPLIQFYKNASLITTPSIVLCPFDTINLNVSNCGTNFEWTKKSEPYWSSNDHSITLSNPGMGIYVETYYLKVTNEYDCSSSDSLNVLWDFSGCVGINEYNNFIAAIFPNPTTGEITINMEQSCDISSVELFNFQGQMLYKQKYNNYRTNQLSLNLTNYKRGIYYLKISLNDRFEIKKIISY